MERPQFSLEAQRVHPRSPPRSPPPYRPTYGSRIAPKKRGGLAHHIPGYLPEMEPLPPGLDNEEIIKRFPNHLRGHQLFVISEHWSAKEIAETCPAKEINTKMMQKRIENARRTWDTGHVPVRKRKRVTAQGATETSQVATPEGSSLFLSPPPPAAASLPSQPKPQTLPNQTCPAPPSLPQFTFPQQSLPDFSTPPINSLQQPPQSSAAAIAFLDQQQSLFSEILREDPSFTLENHRRSKYRKREVAYERMLVNQAESRIRAREMEGEVTCLGARVRTLEDQNFDHSKQEGAKGSGTEKGRVRLGYTERQ